MQVGDRVQMTEYARERNIHPQGHRNGVVTGIKRSGSILVRRDGNVQAGLYDVSFWELVK